MMNAPSVLFGKLGKSGDMIRIGVGCYKEGMDEYNAPKHRQEFEKNVK
jgi:hypothetical protein